MKRNGHNGEGLPGSLEAFMLSHLRMPPVQDYPRPQYAPEPIKLPDATSRLTSSDMSDDCFKSETAAVVDVMLKNGCTQEQIKDVISLMVVKSSDNRLTSSDKMKVDALERKRERDREYQRKYRLKVKKPSDVSDDGQKCGISIDKKDTIDKKESKEVRGSGIRARVEYPADFESFWKSYPRTPTMGKAETFAVWKKIPAEERQLAAAAVPKFVAWLKTQKPDYPVIHACRFLSKKRFDGFHAAEASRENTKIPPWERDGITKDEWLKQKGITNGASRG